MKQQNSRAEVERSVWKVLVLFRTVLAGVALAWVSALAYGDALAMEKVETTNAILTFKAGSGDLAGVQWKRPKLDIIAEPRLGENFRILLPLPDYEANYFNSRDQVVRKVDKSPDGVVLHYGPLKNEREEVNVDVTYEIRDTGTQLQFSIQVDNGTDQKLAEVFYGIIGGQQGIGERLDTESLIPGPEGIGNFAPRIFGEFPQSGRCCMGNSISWSGYTYPGNMPMGWMDVYNPKAVLGYYYANQDPETRVTMLYMELRPYVARYASKDNWLRATQLPKGEPIGMTMGWVNFPYAGKGIFRAGPIALQVHTGDWHTAAKIYRGWFDQHFQLARTPNWLRKEMAWQDVMLLSPEDEVFFRFKDLPKVAAEGKRYGVTTLQLFGWAVGGQDRGRPSYVPDPRLGTREEFRKALADIRAMGVHAIVYVNVQTADPSIEDFKTRYSRYAVEGRWGQERISWEWGSGTIGARLLDTAGHVMTLMSPSHPEFREGLLGQYLDVIRDGAEALQFDWAQRVGDLDFNPNLPTSPDKSLPQGMKTTMEEFLKRARTINPDVGLSVLDSFDRTFPTHDTSYGTLYSNVKDVQMALRYTFPEWSFIADAVDPSSFDMLNSGLCYGLFWGMSPRSAAASMEDELTRPLSRYLSELIRIRKQYADLLFHGRFNDTLGATVTGDEENIRYSVFIPMNSDSPQRACVVANFGDRDEIVEVSLQGKEGRQAKISTPFQSDRMAGLPVKLTLPPHRAAVVVAEQ